MDGRRKFQVQPNDKSLTPSFWSRFTDIEEPTVRNKLVFLTIDEVGSHGAAEFNATKICDRLAVSPSLINHYFDGRNGLIAEAAATAYRSYVYLLRDAAQSDPDPRSALRAWMVAQVQWAQQNPGFAHILNYSAAHGDLSTLLVRDYQREITEYFEFNMAIVVTLIRALQNGVTAQLPEHPTDIDRSRVTDDPNILALAGSVAWSALGPAVWASGQHAPSARTPETIELFAHALDTHIWLTLDAVDAAVRRV